MVTTSPARYLEVEVTTGSDAEEATVADTPQAPMTIPITEIKISDHQALLITEAILSLRS
jgi:hypothetical protein